MNESVLDSRETEENRRLRLNASWREAADLVENSIKVKAAAGRALEILEAGCGKEWGLNLGEVRYRLTGVDLDATALYVRKNVLKDLDEAVHGDLRSVNLEKAFFDVIYCSYVLEHVDGAEQVMSNFVKWLRPNGILILKIPDPLSVGGFVTRVTPFWFHKLFYRLTGHPHAGKPGHGPYPTYYDPVVSRKGIQDFAARMNLTIKAEYGDGYPPGSGGTVWRVIRLVARGVGMLSFGHLSVDHNNLLYIIQKNEAA